MRLVNRLSIGLLLTAAAAFAQYPIPGASGGGGGGGGCVAGTGITCVGSTISVDTAVIESRATAQSGASTYCRSTTGSATMTCALTPTLTAYTTGSCLSLNADFANVTTATLDVDALGVKSILNRSGAALAAGDIPLNKPVGICYDGTQWIVQGNGASSVTSFPANAQTGTTYTVLTGDRANVVTFLNAGAIAVTLPQAGVSFPDGWFFYAKNIGAGVVTITPTTSTISGAASITLEQGEWAVITSNGTNYQSMTSRVAIGSGLAKATSEAGVTLNTAPEVLTLTNTSTVTNKDLSSATNSIGPNAIKAYVAGGGTAQAQTVTLSPALPTYAAGGKVCWLPVAANSATAPTLNVSGLGAKTITKLGTTALVANDLTTTAVACAIYDGTQYQLQNPQVAVSSGNLAYFNNRLNNSQASSSQDACMSVVTGGGIGTNCTDANTPAGVTGSAKNLYIKHRTAQPGGCDLTFTLTVNDVDTALTATIPGGSSAGTTVSDTTHTVALTPSDSIKLHVVNGACTSAEILGVSFVIQ